MNKGGVSKSKPTDCYFLKLEVLRVGDVILTSSPGQSTSVLIRAITGSDYSHAILVLHPPYAIESSDYGVVMFCLDRFAVRKPTNVTVRRVRSEFIKKLDVASIVKFAENIRTREYAEHDMLTALFAHVPRFEQGKFFCSQLVAEAYSIGGLPLVPGRSPEKITPGMLATSEVLEDIHDFLKFCPSSVLPFIPAFLDGPNEPSPAERETEARQQAIEIAASTFERHGRTVYDFNQALLTLLQCWSEGQPYTLELDQTLAGAMMEAGLPYIVPEHFPGHADELFMDFYIQNAIVLGQMSIERQRDLLDLYRTEQLRIRATNSERDADVTRLREWYGNTGLESVRLHLASCWEAFLVARRIELAQQRAIEILELSLNNQLPR